jgi:2-hydroxy-6-oxonona-2,4-dienedioate hydrolase
MTGSDPNAYQSIWTTLMDLPFCQGYVDAAGVRTRYVQAGPKDAPKLIMLHGMGGSWENCFSNIPPHALHFNTYAFDMLGHGFTDKPNKPIAIADYVDHLRNCMDALGIEKASFLGVSLGSWVATKFAAQFPARVGKVTMISAWGRTSAAPKSASGAEAAQRLKGREARLKAVETPTWAAMESIFEGLILDPGKRLPDLLGLRLKIYRQPSMRQAMENIFLGLDEAWRSGTVSDEEARSIRNPYLIIAAIDSKDAFLACSYEYAKLFPNVKLIEQKGASHWAQWEAGDDFNRINLEFLRS